MGKSAQVFISQVALGQNILHDMYQWSNANSYLKLLNNHEDTFLLH